MKTAISTLNKVDIFAKEIKFRFDATRTPKRVFKNKNDKIEIEEDPKPHRKNVSKLSTIFGGTITLLTTFTCMAYAYGRFSVMFGRDETRIVNY